MDGAPLFDPETHCIRCNRRYNAADEDCRGCGFSYINGDEEAEAEQQSAVYRWSVRNLPEEQM